MAGTVPSHDDAFELRDFVEHILAPLHRVGPDGTILWVNQAELDLLGYARDEYVGRHIADFHVDRPVIDDILARLSRDETLRGHPARMRHKDGSIRDVLINSSVLWRDGEFVHTRCLTIDVTDRRLADEERQRAERNLAAQYAVTHALVEMTSLEDAAPRVLRAVGEMGGWTVGGLWTIDDTQQVLRCVDLWHAGDADAGEFESITRRTTFGRGIGLPGRVWATGASAWIEDVSLDPNFPRGPYAARAGLRGGFGFPIHVRDHVIGVLELFTREARQPDATLSRLFDAIGTQIGQFIERRQFGEVRERLAAIVDSSDDAIISKTLDGVITSWNRGAEHVFGYTADEAVGRHITLIIPPERHAEEDGVLARLRRGERIAHFETERQTRDGRRRQISLTVSPVRNADGRIVGASKVARDITDRKQAEVALRESQRRAQALYEEAAQAVHARDEFISIASHELHNPISALQLQLVGLVRAAERRGGMLPAEWVRERVGQAAGDVARLVRLVHSLLDVSRINAGRLELELEDVDFVAIITTVAERLTPQLKPGQLTVEAADSVVGRWDRLRLDQVAMNLLSNAVKYGSGRPIRVTLEAGGDTARLTVADQGIGIDADALARLFERFQRGVSRRDYGGFGLGLWITRKVLDAMGGTIAVESQPGQGSTFRVTLPLQPVPDAPRAEPARREQQTEAMGP